jgi:hypothetical protein
MSVPTRGEIYSKLLHHIHMAEEHSATMAHLHNTEDSTKDKALARAGSASVRCFALSLLKSPTWRKDAYNEKGHHQS